MDTPPIDQHASCLLYKKIWVSPVVKIHVKNRIVNCISWWVGWMDYVLDIGVSSSPQFVVDFVVE